jgi:oligopeptidase A
MNPLLQGSDLPDFATIRPEHVGPALDVLLADADDALERAVGPDVAADYDTLAAVLDPALERLRSAWSAVGHLQAVADTPQMRAAHAEHQPRVIDFHTRLGADARLFAKYLAVAAGAGAARLAPAQRKALADALRNFVLGGVELQGQARERHAAIQKRAGVLSRRFGDNVLDATDAFSLTVTDASELDGLPEDVREAARAAAAAAGQDGWRLTLQAPCYVPVMQFARHRPLREAMFRAHHTRASEFGPPERDNGPLMRELLELRHEEGALLGHHTYAHLALVPKMAGSPGEVLAFVRELADRARPHADREVAELRQFAARELGLPDFQAWDRAYAAEQLRQSRYAFSEQDLKRYFTEPRVLAGLFRLVETLFDVAIHEDRAPLWHDSVRFYRVWRGGEPVAAFYLDLYARAGKRSGAWMDDCRTRWRRPDGRLQLPVAHLVCNFAPPVGDKPALLRHDDVITLFHEFGHGLHHMLTQVDEMAVSGIAGVEGDAVELPSQFMENFCWEWEVLQRLTGHVDTGEPLPRALFDRMVAARHFHSAMQMLRQCEFALFDMRLHAEPGAAARVQQVANEASAEMAPLPPPPEYRFANSFSHLFCGGYAAGYYGYAWAEVLSADAYGAFEEAGVFDPATGERFRRSILEVGGSRPALESFRAFRGRDPQIDALLRHQGLA